MCPACGSLRVFRSHRRHVSEIVRSWMGSYPYRCHGCQSRFFRNEHGDGDSAGLRPDRRPEARRQAGRRILRESGLYACALAVFLAFLFYMMREPAP
jgi:hypothetical protein